MENSIAMQRARLLVLLTAVVVCLKSGVEACSHGSCKIRQVCLKDSDCSPGLFCSTCVADGDLLRRCHRYKATNVTAIRNGLPFNKYSWLTTHNSFAIVGSPSHTGVPRVTFENQEDSVTDQLNEPAINTLKEIETFLSANPTEIVTIFIEDYVSAPKGLTKVFTAAGLMKYWFPVSRMPKNGQDWPTVTDMVAKNQRLVVFTSKRSKEANEGIAYEWRYVNENQYGNGGINAGHCPNRSESAFLNTTSRSLILENFFPDNPVQVQACKYNSAMLQQMLSVCYKAAGNRWANFLAVDFYKRSDGGGSFQAVDTLNAEGICGCSDVNMCKLNLPRGVCNSPSSGPNAAPSKTGPPKTSDAFLLYAPMIMTNLCLVLSFVILLVSMPSL